MDDYADSEEEEQEAAAGEGCCAKESSDTPTSGSGSGIASCSTSANSQVSQGHVCGRGGVGTCEHKQMLQLQLMLVSCMASRAMLPELRQVRCRCFVLPFKPCYDLLPHLHLQSPKRQSVEVSIQAQPDGGVKLSLQALAL